MESIEMETVHSAVVKGGPSRCTVLLVEDDEVNVLVAKELLRFASKKVGIELEVVVARSARDARAMWVDSNPSLVLLDVNLPDGRGDDVCREMTESAVQRPYVICSSAETREDDPKKLKRYGIDAVMPKPLRMEGLVDFMSVWKMLRLATK